MGISQRELAKLVGASHSTIVRLDDADYTGHSLTLLTRIAAALGKHVQVALVDAAQWMLEQGMVAPMYGNMVTKRWP